MGISVALSSTVSRSNWNLGMLVFVEGGKTGVSGDKPSEQGREPTRNPAYCGNSGNSTQTT